MKRKFNVYLDESEPAIEQLFKDQTYQISFVPAVHMYQCDVR